MLSIPVSSPSGTLYAVIDDRDADLAQFRWHMAGGKHKVDGRAVGQYAARGIVVNGRKTSLLLHRVVAERMGLIPSSTPEAAAAHGRWKISIDHENGNKLDCQRSNLRLRDRSRQMLNTADKLRSTNRSGYRGVSFVKMRERYGKPWMAYVQHHGKSMNLGWYATAGEAADARRLWDERECP
jgi:hypothetical protein